MRRIRKPLPATPAATVLIVACSVVCCAALAAPQGPGGPAKKAAGKSDGPGTPAGKASKEAARDLKAAVAVLNSGQVDKAIELLEAIVARHAGDDPSAERAAALLSDCGVGDEARVVLIDRKTFRDGFKIREIDILALAETAIETLRPYYRNARPFFEKRHLKLTFYDSQATYRRAGGGVTAGGHFGVARADYKTRELWGEIEWHVPKHAATLKDRQLSIQSTLYHETAHYWNAIVFGGALPSLWNEGIATYLQSRLQRDFYQYYRTTDRLEIESNARHALNAIAKLEDFEDFLAGERGFGQGGEMVTRWYGLAYSLCDFFEEGTLGGRKSSFAALLAGIEATAGDAAAKTQRGKRPPRLAAKSLLETLVRDLYGSDLAAFHRALVAHILARYKQR